MPSSNYLNLHLVRSVTSCESPYDYESKTEVMVLGDVTAFSSLVGLLKQAISSPAPVHVPIDLVNTYSMAGLILPATPMPRQAVLRIFERPVVLMGVPTMEVVFWGNVAAYERLATAFSTVMTRYADNPAEHLHIDDCLDEYLVKRSISLNIRGPVRHWSKSSLQEWASVVFERQPTYLPAELDPAAVTQNVYTLPKVRCAPTASLDELWSETREFPGSWIPA